MVQSPGGQPQQQMPQQDAQPQAATQAPNPSEKYNTVFLTNNIVKERRRNQMILLGVVLALLMGGAVWSVLMPKEPAAPVAKADAKADAGTPANAEASAAKAAPADNP